MKNQIFDTVTEWDTTSFSGGYDGLNILADAGFSGAIKTDSTWSFMVNGYVIGVVNGSITAFDRADGTVYKAPDPSLPLLHTMQSGDSKKQAEYYTKDTPISEAEDTLSSGNFTGYIKLSERVLSGDYFIVYYGGHSMSVAFVGPNRRLFTGDEAFERTDDEIGIYKIYAADINIVDIPELETTTKAETAAEETQNNLNTAQTKSGDADGNSRTKDEIVASRVESEGLSEELAEEKEWLAKMKKKIQSGFPPVTTPSIPRLSLAYDDVKKSDLIGSGGNADVYRAKATTHSDEITLAIKQPRMSGTIDSERINELIDEAQTWQQLDEHNHIVSVVDYGSTPLPWIGMEFMDGGDLSERAGEVSFDQAIWTALAITKGVRYAHKQGVAHFDLKPTNILFRSVNGAWDVPKIADWGLSKNLLEHSKSVEGLSPRYAAPEQLDSRQFGQTDNVTDVYQLGTVIYELFTGKPPYEGQTYEVINRIQSTTPMPPSESADLPEEVDDIILTALATQKGDRYDDVIYLRDALRDLWEEYS